MPQTVFDVLVLKHATDDGFRIGDLVRVIVKGGGKSVVRCYRDDKLHKRERRAIKEPWADPPPPPEEEEEGWVVLGSDGAEKWDLGWV